MIVYIKDPTPKIFIDTLQEDLLSGITTVHNFFSECIRRTCMMKEV